MKVQEALKAAIEAMEFAQINTVFAFDRSIRLCKSALSEIEKCEPVAYVVDTPNMYGATVKHGLPHNTPLYTSPISKEWVVIDEETIDDIGNTLSDEQGFIPVETWTEFARAIEAKLKQLNAPEKG